MANHSREFATRECHGTHSCHENIKVGSCPGTTPSRGLLPDTPNFPIIPCPSGQGGYKYCLLHIHRLGTTPIGGFAPDLPSYGCAGPHLTKIQFRSRCVRAGTISKTPREEWAVYSQAPFHTEWECSTNGSPSTLPKNSKFPNNFKSVVSSLPSP